MLLQRILTQTFREKLKKKKKVIYRKSCQKLNGGEVQVIWLYYSLFKAYIDINAKEKCVMDPIVS